MIPPHLLNAVFNSPDTQVRLGPFIHDLPVVTVLLAATGDGFPSRLIVITGIIVIVPTNVPDLSNRILKPGMLRA